jgi:hypothetical protein
MLVVVLLACGATSVTFEPSTVHSENPVCARARRFYYGDGPELLQAGARIVGEIAAKGNAFADQEDLAEDASLEAAEHGGTHYILTERETKYVFLPITQTTAHCTGTSQHIDCTVQPGAEVPLAKPRARFVVVRVDPNRWDDLTPALRPRPLR